MSAAEDSPAEDPTALEELFEAKALAELGRSDCLAPGTDTPRWSGDVFAEVVLVKGDAGPAEVAGGRALTGPDGQAAKKALEALGFDPKAVFATVARPDPDIDADLIRQRLRMQVEAVDPYAVVALDAVAAQEVAVALTLGSLPFGVQVSSGGRVFVAVDGLEASLDDEVARRRVWDQFRALEPRPKSF